MSVSNPFPIRLRSYATLGHKAPVLLMLVLLVFNIAAPRVFADSVCDTDTPMIASSDGSLTECQRQLYASGIYDFDLKTITPGCSASGGAGTIDANLNGSDNEAKAFDYFKNTRGLPAMTAAAIVGNLLGESGLNPTRTGGYIAQWGGSRLTNLQNFANKQGQPITSLALQLDFVSVELRLIPVPDGIQAGDYSHVVKDTEAQTTIEDATAYFMGTYTFDWYKTHYYNGKSDYSYLDSAAIDFVNKHGAVAGYEGPGIPHLDHRISNAKGALQLYGGQAAATASQPATDPTQATQTTTPTDTTTTDSTSSGCSADGSSTGGGGPAVAGEGFIGNCDGKGSTAEIHCGQCVAYTEWALGVHGDPAKGPYTSLTDQSGPDAGAAATITKNLGAKGFTVNRTPAVHATFSMSGAAGALGNHWGHTGIVSKVILNPDGSLNSVIVEHSNWVGPHNSELYGQTTFTAAQLQKYDTTFAHTEVGWR